MNIAYLFKESVNIWVPCLRYDGSVIEQISHTGGIWNENRLGFVFKLETNPEQLLKIFDIVCVFTVNLPDEDNLIQFQIFGFWERPWRNESKQRSVKNTERSQINSFSFPEKIDLSEILSEYWCEKLETELRSKKYSIQTQRAYIYYNRLFCRTLQKSPEEINTDDLTKFLALMEKNRNYSASAINLAISAIKFFYKYVLKNDSISEQRRPRQDKRLPVVLSKEEIVKILGTEKNPKHRLLLMLIYSSGLRVSEVVSLKTEHIDLSRGVIYIRQGKGMKDRCTMLSEKAAQYIKEYYKCYGIDKWIFPGQKTARHMSIRSAQYIFNKAVRKAGISKNISIHGLRHTFATHLLENGTDIRYIQALLGHANLRTTERYTHVARRSVLNVKSPFDSLV
ncbi:MAG: tyrosine-type recombinase/integrase [Treponema sp.]|nr:tyrosine-type recombinase/integrase [Treponema sp.]